MINTNDINQAFAKFIKLPWMAENDRTSISSEFGSDVLSAIDEILLFASDDFAWTEEDDIKAHSITIGNLKTEYAFLTDDALIKATNIAAYYWK